MARWWLHDDGQGSLEQVCCEHHPCDPAEPGGEAAHDWSRENVTELPRRGDLYTEEWRDGAWHDRMDLVAEVECRVVDFTRERRIGRLLDKRGISFAKQRKGEEAKAYVQAGIDSQTLSNTILSQRFPWLVAEANERGITLSQMAQMVSEAMLDDELALSEIDRTALTAKKAIRDAATREEAHAITRAYINE